MYNDFSAPGDFSDVSEEFRQNVRSGNKDTVRSALLDYLNIDRTFRKFDTALRYAREHLDILEQEKGTLKMEADPSRWDQDYLNSQRAALMMNFSEDRIAHLKKVIQAVSADTRRQLYQTKEPTRDANTTPPGKTGRKVISERPVTPWEGRSGGTSQRETGREVIGEREIPGSVYSAGEEQKPTDMARFFVVGGIAVAVAGGIAIGAGAAAAESAAILKAGKIALMTGAVITCAGGCMEFGKGKGGKH